MISTFEDLLRFFDDSKRRAKAKPKVKVEFDVDFDENDDADAGINEDDDAIDRDDDESIVRVHVFMIRVIDRTALTTSPRPPNCLGPLWPLRTTSPAPDAL